MSKQFLTGMWAVVVAAMTSRQSQQKEKQPISKEAKETEASFATFNADVFKGTPIQKQYDSLGNDPARFGEFVKKVISKSLKLYDWLKDVKIIKAPVFMAIGDADGVRYEQALELFRAKGGGKQGECHGLSKARLAILPGTTRIGIFMQRQNWLIPMISDFLDSDLNEKPQTFLN